jgi:hypothetical protein
MTRDDRIRASADRWLAAAVADADRRGLPELRSLFEGLAEATVTLRAADWNDTLPGGGREASGGREAGGAGETNEEGGGREAGQAADGEAGGGKAEAGRPGGAR